MTNRKRILIVEDEMVLAMLIEDMVHELGYEPIGPAMTLELALTLSAEDLDGAILDMNLVAGCPSTPVAEKLRVSWRPLHFRDWIRLELNGRDRRDASADEAVLDPAAVRCLGARGRIDRTRRPKAVRGEMLRPLKRSRSILRRFGAFGARGRKASARSVNDLDDRVRPGIDEDHLVRSTTV